MGADVGERFGGGEQDGRVDRRAGEGVVRDCRGVEIVVGCKVVRPGGLRGSPLREYEVTKLVDRGVLAPSVWAGCWMRPDQVAVVEAAPS